MTIYSAFMSGLHMQNGARRIHTRARAHEDQTIYRRVSLYRYTVVGYGRYYFGGSLSTAKGHKGEQHGGFSLEMEPK